MNKLSARKKLLILKIVGIFLCPLTIFFVTTIFVLLGCSELWGSISQNGISSWSQWVTLILYRFNIYLMPAMILSLFHFDKRYKWMTRLIIFLSWTFFIYLFSQVIISFFEIDTLLNINIFSNLDNAILLFGYILTAINKRRIEFDSNGAIIGELRQ